MSVSVVELHSDAVTLSDLCSLAARMSCEQPEWELSALLVTMAHIEGRISDGLDRHIMAQGAEVNHAAA